MPFRIKYVQILWLNSFTLRDFFDGLHGKGKYSTLKKKKKKNLETNFVSIIGCIMEEYVAVIFKYVLYE